MKAWLSVSLWLCCACAQDDTLPVAPGLVSADRSQGALSAPMPALTGAARSRFFVGNSFFNQNWVSAPASVTARDGLGPLFNARSCSACHFRDGRSDTPADGEDLHTLLLRLSVPSSTAGAPAPDPVYGDQLQTQAVADVPPEARVRVTYERIAGAFADGERYELRVPHFSWRELGYGPTAAGLQVSARCAPQLTGLGLLEAVPESTILAWADPEDSDHDGISGRANWLTPAADGTRRLGRFGWKAEQPSLREQIAAAFVADMGITSQLRAAPNHSPAQLAAREQPNGGEPEISDETLDTVLHYVRMLALPAARAQSGEGRRLFTAAGCQHCHRATLSTGPDAEPPELRAQWFHPYTDLLLHDLGEALDDGRPSFAASGREWRTAPLMGIGLVQQVNAHASFLHDGRARTLSEAILYHGGEAASARARFVAFSRAERAALITFLESL